MRETTRAASAHSLPQALQCCLGVKASDTGRANTFKKVRTSELPNGEF